MIFLNNRGIKKNSKTFINIISPKSVRFNSLCLADLKNDKKINGPIKSSLLNTKLISHEDLEIVFDEASIN